MSGASPTPLESLAAWAAASSDAALQKYCTPHTLRRFHDAHHGDLEKAKAGLKESSVWHAATIDPSFSCSLCAASNSGAHSFVYLGRDARGNSVFYGCSARASEGGEVPLTIAHCANALERTFEGEDADADPRRWVWVVDFNGYGFVHSLQARLGMAFGLLFRDRFPERLSAIILINPPTLFKMLISALGAIADARTMAKLQTVIAPTPKDAIDELRSRFGIDDADMLSWLSTAFSTPAVPGTLPPVPEAARAFQV
jgi:hypothetical protein